MGLPAGLAEFARGHLDVVECGPFAQPRPKLLREHLHVPAGAFDAAKRTGLEQASLRVESAESVTWADGSLGCPQPGMSYTMALVPGYRVKVRAGEQTLDYHASQRGHFFLCPAGRSEEPVRDEQT